MYPKAINVISVLIPIFHKNKEKELRGRNSRKIESPPIKEAKRSLFNLAFLLKSKETEVNNKKSKAKFKKKRISKYTFMLSPKIA